MNNSQVADTFTLLAQLMEIHGENSFKIKSYSIAAYTIDKLAEQVADMDEKKLATIKGIGASTAKKIGELLETGQLSALVEMISKTPRGVVEMLSIKGLGPKKIATVWKEMGIESIGELQYACNENRLLLYKGFGEKTQQTIKNNINFYLNSKGRFLYAELDVLVAELKKEFSTAFATSRFSVTGAFARQLPIIDTLQWLTTVNADELKAFMIAKGFHLEGESEEQLLFKSEGGLQTAFFLTTAHRWGTALFKTSSGDIFLSKWLERNGPLQDVENEQALFGENNVPFIPAYRRDDATFLNLQQHPIPIEVADIKGIIHCHSNWSDGVADIVQMAENAIEMGMQYMVLSDHSKAAFYANGLTEERVLAQHIAIDDLNRKLAPFRIFKSIEADILYDGKLDYSDEVLSSFDMVIASVHAHLKMDKEKAMSRLLTAIKNPFTTILGHATGRLLLSREGYPVDHTTLIDACVEHNVVIELNAHPRRLDIDWSWLNYAVKKGAVISINPDAHSLSGFNDIKYGVKVAQKSLVTKENNLSSFSLQQLTNHILQKKQLLQPKGPELSS